MSEPATEWMTSTVFSIRRLCVGYKVVERWNFKRVKCQCFYLPLSVKTTVGRAYSEQLEKMLFKQWTKSRGLWCNQKVLTLRSYQNFRQSNSEMHNQNTWIPSFSPVQDCIKCKCKLPVEELILLFHFQKYLLTEMHTWMNCVWRLLRCFAICWLPRSWSYFFRWPWPFNFTEVENMFCRYANVPHLQGPLDT